MSTSESVIYDISRIYDKKLEINTELHQIDVYVSKIFGEDMTDRLFAGLHIDLEAIMVLPNTPAPKICPIMTIQENMLKSLNNKQWALYPTDMETMEDMFNGLRYNCWRHKTKRVVIKKSLLDIIPEQETYTYRLLFWPEDADLYTDDGKKCNPYTTLVTSTLHPVLAMMSVVWFCSTHGWTLTRILGSNAKCPYIAKENRDAWRMIFEDRRVFMRTLKFDV